MMANWKVWVLRLAAVHCGIWGLFIIGWPAQSAVVYGFEGQLTDEFLWRGCGLTILLFGLGYGIASFDPRRHVAPVLVGLVAKVAGPTGMMFSVWQGEVSSRVLWLLPVNDVIWWLPLLLIVADGFQPKPARTNRPRPPEKQAEFESQFEAAVLQAEE